MKKLTISALTVCLAFSGLAIAVELDFNDVNWSQVKTVWHTLTASEQAEYMELYDEYLEANQGQIGSTPAATILGKSVMPSPRAASDTCGMGYEIGALPYADTNATTGFVDDYQLLGDCGGATSEPYTGEDLTYLVQVDQTCDLFATITNDDYDSALYVLTDCGAQTCVAGGDDPEDLTFTATAGTDYWVVVDGWSGQDGNYDLTISESTATGCLLVPVELQSFSAQ